MKIVIIFGSPRKKGNTASLLAPFIDELQQHQADIELFDVYEKNIAGCRACLGCQSDKSHITCVVRDDMQPVLSALADSDFLVIAAPIYLWSVPAPVKAVLDRIVYSSCKYYGDDPQGPALLNGKRLALFATCGYPPEKAADLYEEAMKRFCKHCRMIYTGMLVERQRNLKEPFMSDDKEARAREFARILLNKAT